MPLPRPAIGSGDGAVAAASRRRRASVPVRHRLLAMVAAVALPLVLFAALISWSQYRNARQQEETQLRQQTRGLAQLVDRKFETTEAVLRTLASSTALARDDLPAFASELRAARDQLGPRAAEPIAIRLMNAKGELLLDTRGGAHVPKHALPASAAAIASGKPQITNLSVANASDSPVVVVLVPVFPPGSIHGPHRAIGTIGADIPRQQLLAIIRNAGVASGGVVSVLDRRGITVVRSVADTRGIGKPPPAAELRTMLSRRDGIMRDVGTSEAVASTIAFVRAPLSGFIVTLDMPERVFLAPLHAALLRTAIIGAAMLLVAFSLAWLFGRSIGRALQRIPDIAMARAHGMTTLSTGLREADDLAAVLGDTLTERSHAEARLQESEERLRLAVDAAEIGLWDVDPIKDLLYWPPRVKAMFGISPDVPVSMTDFYAGLHPEDRERVRAAFAIALDPAARAVYDVEYRTIGKEDRVVRWLAAKGRGIFDNDGRCIRVIGTAIDISARKAAEQQLRELNETLEQRVAQAISERDRVWRNSRDLLVVVDRDGIFRAVNPAWRGILGHDPSEVIGRRFLDFVWPEDADMMQRGLETATSVGNLTNFENRLCHKDGTPRWISWYTTREGDLVYAYGRHVTAEKAAAADLTAAQETLHQAQRIETVGQLTGGVAHDFNNLLTPIVGTLELLNRKLEQDRSARRLIAAALQAADRARILIQRLLAFSRRQHLEERAVDVRSLIESLTDLASRSLGPRIRLVLHIAEDLPPARVDPNQLELALLNLAVNARDAMGGAGTLTVVVTEETVEHAAHLSPGRYVRIAVTDTGRGMDADTLKRAVEPFFTTKGIGRGTGLGLSMVHGLAAQSGGDFALRSSPGTGTTATLWLPVSEEIAIRLRSETSGQVPDQRIVGSATVLLVDDEELVRATTADILTDAGLVVSQAASAGQALQMLKAGLQPDVLVTDYAMPGITGAALAREARILRPGLPVLLITGYASLSDREAGALPRLAKPFRQSDILAMLAKLLKTARLAQDLD